MGRVGAADLTVLLLYILGVVAWGAWLGRGQRGAREYFLADRDLPWGAVLLSVVATETSTLTFLSVPAVAYIGDLGFLQLAVGYLAGRAAVAAFLLPGYHRGRLSTVYEALEGAFGRGTRRFTSGIFMATRLLADAVRLFATAIPLALLTGWSYPVSIAALAAATLVYTYAGGIRAVVWVDVVQMGLYVAGGLAAAAVLQGAVSGGWPAIAERAAAAGKLGLFDLSLDLSRPYTLWAGLVGGAFLSMGSHGTDQLMVQRLLACRDLGAARRALVGSAAVVFVQFALFLAVGLGLWVYYEGRAFARPDEVFALFIVEALPPGLRGLLVAAVFAAAMSSLSSSINSLASASTYDFWAAARPEPPDERRLLRVGRAFTLAWAVALAAGAVAFIPLSRGTAAVEVALGVASLVYGGLLGAFGLALARVRLTAARANLAVAAGIGGVVIVWATGRAAVAWPWYVLIGSLLTYATGLLLSGRAAPRPLAGKRPESLP